MNEKSIAEEYKAKEEEEKDRVSTAHCVMWRTTVRKGRGRNRHVGRISPLGGWGRGRGVNGATGTHLHSSPLWLELCKVDYFNFFRVIFEIFV